MLNPLNKAVGQDVSMMKGIPIVKARERKPPFISRSHHFPAAARNTIPGRQVSNESLMSYPIAMYLSLMADFVSM